MKKRRGNGRREENTKREEIEEKEGGTRMREMGNERGWSGDKRGGGEMEDEWKCMRRRKRMEGRWKTNRDV